MPETDLWSRIGKINYLYFILFTRNVFTKQKRMRIFYLQAQPKYVYYFVVVSEVV